MDVTNPRVCPSCGGTEIIVVARGFAGRTDTPDQFFICQRCGQRTYEIIAASQRDIRLNRYERQGVISREGLMYEIQRILKVGFDEHLLYLRVVPEPEPEGAEADASEAEG